MTRITDITDLSEAKVLLRRAVNVLRPFAKSSPKVMAEELRLRADTRVMPLAQGGSYHEFCIPASSEFKLGDLRAARDLMSELEEDPGGRE
jgi:hypothetical protein